PISPTAAAGQVAPAATDTPPASTPSVQRRSPPTATALAATTLAPTLIPTPRLAPSPTAVDQRYAFLLLGYGGGGHDGTYLTDSMMVLIVDPARKTLTMLSLPRDAWVPMSFDGKTQIYNKVNTAYAFAMNSSFYPNRLDRYKGNQG